jgi:hypothetical protein
MYIFLAASMRFARPAVALGVFLAALVFRLATFSITNDDYLHLSLAQQVLLGEVPGRDFIDPGEFLFYYVSAGVQWLFGRHLLGEVLLDSLMLAAGYALVYLLAHRVSRSHVAALTTTSVAVLLVPRLYSYPKILLYAIAIGLLWRYADRAASARAGFGEPGRGRLIGLALFTAVAFLFRHDHGACIGLAAVTMVLLSHRRDGAATLLRKIAVFGAATAVFLLPFFVFLQLHVGLVSYVRNTMETGRAEYQRTVGRFPRFSSTLALPRVHIRWAAETDAAARRALEQRFSLEAGTEEGAGTWRYDLRDAGSANVAAMLSEPRVADTSGIDRTRGVVTARTHEPNVDAWFYYLTIALPPVALFALLALLVSRRGSGAAREPQEIEQIVSVSVLAMVMHVYLLRAASDSAIADVSVPTAVLGAWLLATAFRRARAATPAAVNWLAPAAATAVLAVTLAAASRSDGGYLLGQLVRGTDALAPLGDKLDAMRRSSAPFADEGAQYLHACTRAGDRVLVTGYMPHVHYQSGRGFAAGRPYFLASFAPSPAYQAFSLARLESERVPIVLATDGEDYASFKASVPRIHDYLEAHYRQVGEIEAGGAHFRVLADTRLQAAGPHGPRALPCF